MSILNFDHQGNISTYSPELLTMTDPHYGDFILANVFDKPLSDLPTTKKLIHLDTKIRAGISMCQQTCQYFSLCGGGAPSNKLAENGLFDSTETMRCRLSKQVLIDVVLEYLEEKYELQGEPDESLSERVERVRKGINNEKKHSENVERWDQWADWHDWGDASV
jgi:uncharacterized protein